MGGCPTYPSKGRQDGNPEEVWKFWGREKSLAPVGVHFMGKLHKMVAFVASYKVVCGGVETGAMQLVILFPLPSLCLPFTMWCTSLDIGKGNNVNGN
jgi:hypothetical protein